MRCWYKDADHTAEDCPAGRAVHTGSGPAGREVERVDRSSALPLAQADSNEGQGSSPARWAAELNGANGVVAFAARPETPFRPASVGDEHLDRLESALEGRGETKFTPPLELSPSPQPILLRRPRANNVHRETDDQLIEPLREACELALRQGIDVVEVDRTTLFELLLHVGAVEAGLSWASENGPCPGEGPCAWHEGLWEAVEEVRR